MKKIILTLILFTVSFSVFADEEGLSNWNFYITTDAAYYFASDYITGGDHFSPTTSAYNGVDLRVTATATQSIPIPFGQNALVSGNTLDFSYSLEVTPVSLRPVVDIAFTPVAFLVFSAGGSIGTGWPLSPISIHGMATLVNSSASNSMEAYKSATPFKNFYTSAYLGARFQFDVAALWPGDWHHIVCLVDWKSEYAGLTGIKDGELWMWQGSGNRTNGWSYVTNFVLGYQMPIVLSMVGLNAQIAGHYSGSDYSLAEHSKYNGSFISASISPLLRFQFNEHHMLTVIASFSNRRSFVEAHSHPNNEPELTYAGNEWYFTRIALSYQYSF